MKINDIGQIPVEDRSEHHCYKLKQEWKDSPKSHNTLLKLLFKIYRWPILISFFAKWANTGVELLNVYILGQTLSYINQENDDQSWAMLCVLMITVIEFVGKYFFMKSNDHQFRYVNRME